MRVGLRDIYVAAKGDDATLNALIQKFIEDWTLNTTVSQWRIDNARDLRRAAYPDIGDVLDALFKVRKNKPGGQAELDALDSQKEQIKNRFPKS